ncbi:hypothetical protein PILCRDRAFT_820197 [Piloderma croceum F 1598]|uniref:G domain-containing protein n=1 Tax=Piloderma croceum (strain F 1598) TaxID=765440 RepID=A0A0C3BZV2_PILCF|nr:hypothetical protein PILCRDRAFT_820197 [Piloderma croceum F 1598]
MSQRDLQHVSKQDRIVAVMGPTGAGKSTFIECATCQDGRTIGHGLRSFTSDIRAVRVNHPIDGRPVVFVDTPGFDDTYKSDLEVLTMIAEWLVKTYKSQSNLVTIIYVHDISDSRMKGSALKDLRVFGTVCGDKAMPNVIIVTTKWKNITIEHGVQREKELETRFWKDMIAAGCVTARFEGSYESAWSIIGSLDDKHQAQVQLSHEIVDSNLRLNETQAGIALNEELLQLIKSQKESARRLRALAQNQNNGLAMHELDEQQAQIEAKIRQTSDQLREMKIPISRQIHLFFKNRQH